MTTLKQRLAFAIMMLSPTVFAATYTWVGAADGNWNAAANWTSSDGGTTYPNSASDIAVFTGDASPKTPGVFTVGGMVLKSGKLQFNTYGYSLQVGGENPVFDFADGSVVVVSGNGGIVAADHLATKLTIKGNCLITNEVVTGKSDAYFARVDVENATIVSSKAAYATVFHLGKGASYKATVGGTDYSNTCFDLAEGAVVDMEANNYGNGVGAFTGLGTVRGFRGKLALPNGPYTFSGTCENLSNGNQCDWTLNPTDAENGYLVVGSANALSNCAVRLPDLTGRSLRFASGIGTFTIGNFATSDSQSLYLEDEANEPVTVFARVEQGALSKTLTSGSGNLIVANKSNNNIVYKGSTLFQHTGILGSLAGIMGQDAQNTTFGDGSNAANDANLSELGGIMGYNLGTSMMSVRHYFKNVNDYTLGGLYGNGQFEFDGAGTATIDNFDVAKLPESGKQPYVVLVGGDVTAKNANAGGCIIQLADGRTLTVNGGEIGSADDLAQINAAGYGTGGYGTISLSDTTLNVGQDSYAKRFEMLDGAVLVHYARLGIPSTATAADPATIYLNGGTLRGVWPSSGYWNIEVPNSSANAEKMKIEVGEKGGRLEASRVDTVYTYKLYAAVSGSGDFAKSGLGVVEVYTPFDITGAFHLEESGLKVQVTSDAESLFGTGSFYLGNGWLDFAVGGKTYGLATGTGAAFHYQNCGAVVVNNGTAANLTIGSEETAAFVREAKGSALLFTSKSSSDTLSGTGAKISVKGTVETTSAGILAQPIFALSQRDGGNRYSIDFVKVNDDGNLVNASDLYKTTFGENDSIVSIASATELAADATVGGLRVSSATVTIPEGKTLSFSEGTTPAAVLLSNLSGGGTVAGDGTLDFGSREGVIAVALSGSDAYEYSGRIASKISGTGGLTLVGNMLWGHSSIRLAHANDYTGGTWVNAVEAGAEADGCFGSDAVYVGTGVGESGSLRLKNVTLANEIHVTGKGKLIGSTYSTSDSGAITKKEAGTATLTGAVELTGDGASVRASVEDAKIVFAGTVSGAALDIVGAGTVELQKANTYTGGTTVSGATVALGNVNALGSGAVVLSDGGTLALTVEKDGATLPNAVSGSGVIALKGTGYGKVSLDNIDADSTLTLAMGNHRRAIVNSLAGFTAVTSSRTSDATLYVTDDAEGSFSGTVPSNVTIAYGEPKLPGFSIIVR